MKFRVVASSVQEGGCLIGGTSSINLSKPLTEKQEKELSEFIAKRKREIKNKSKKGKYTQ